MKITQCNKCKKAIFNSSKSGLCRSCYRATEDKKKIDKWLSTGDTGCGISTTLRNCIRDYIYNNQHNKCAICGIERIWNNKQLNFVLDHIDGDASNNHKENLRLICPNCDSQLDTFKSKNKKSARTFRDKYK